MVPRWRFRRFGGISLALMVLFVWFMSWPEYDHLSLGSQYPLLTRYINVPDRKGGSWYLPPEWIQDLDSPPENIIDAAKLALLRSQSTPQRHIPHSAIPLIIHQTWKNTNIDTWTDLTRQGVEKWLAAAQDGQMAYFLWDDDGVAQLLHHFEPGLEEHFYSLPSNVERSDVFRILVSKWIGGIYGDMDTEPLRSPLQWITASDLLPWRDPETGDRYNFTGPVRALIGLEADCPPNSDTYWRMGYTYPVQLTQWSFAWAPGHPILQEFLDRLSIAMQEASGDKRQLSAMDPLVLTGPAAFTESAQSWLTTTTGLRWNALSGLHDGGMSKLVGDVLVLPITGFSPGRGKYGNMGSKSVHDPSARLRHRAQGSWRKFDVFVEYGKFCRTMFGLCRDWTKVPHAGLR